MSYQIYITDALVCGSTNSNTSDRSYLLFTREAGMIWVSAKSAREERSKHRYSLQEFGVVRASLVRGKSGWRVTGTEPIHNLYFAATTREARILVRNMTRLVRRFVQGEISVPAVFDDLVGVHECTDYDVKELEVVLTLRMLHELGYIAPQAEYQSLLDAPDVQTAYTNTNDRNLQASARVITHALDISHL